MKKNITINMFGTLYQIDEDAYELLKNYQDNMRSYYAKRKGSEEVCDDVEHRIAELFNELIQQGNQAITIEHVREIMQRIGNPEQMDGASEEDSAPESTPHEAEKSTKKLYRDPQDAYVGGVISGICHYFGWSEVWLPRLIFVLLCLFSHVVLVLVYAICWALIPEATTAEQRLEMCGKPVTPNSLKDEIIKNVQQFKEKNATNIGAKNNAAGCLPSLLKIALFCVLLIAGLSLGGLLLGVLIPLFIALICSILGIGAAAVFGAFNPDVQLILETMPTGALWLCISSFMVAIIMPLFLVVHAIFRKRDSKPMPAWSKIGLFILWLIALAVAIGSLIVTTSVIEEQTGHNDYHHHYSLFELSKNALENEGVSSGVYVWQDSPRLEQAIN